MKAWIKSKALKLAYALSSEMVRLSYDSMFKVTSNWRVTYGGEITCTKPMPISLYPGESRLYYANGWGRSEDLWFWEEWMLRDRAKSLNVRGEL